MAPTQIGRFEIISELGTHPLGMLYKANDPKRGHIALLTIASASLTPTTRQQVQQLFSRARTATLLNSPNIASIYGGGEADGYVHLAMEFVDGVTLRTQMARDGKVSSSELVDIARQLCTALDHAHSKGVIHQNLHPGNIKVEWDGTAKLMDYGLDIPGKHAADDAALAFAHRYASPEQLRGEALTFKSNLYTLGTILYELASGKKAVAVEDNDRVREEVLDGQIQPARGACLDVPKVISDAIAKAISKVPSDRYDSAAALLRDLESYRQVKKEAPPAPVIAAVEPQPVVASQKPKSKSYGGPNTSAIMTAMQENFRQQAPRPAAGGLASAQLPDLPAPPSSPAPTAQQSGSIYATVPAPMSPPDDQQQPSIAPVWQSPQQSKPASVPEFVPTGDTSSYLQSHPAPPKQPPVATATAQPQLTVSERPPQSARPRPVAKPAPKPARPLIKLPSQVSLVIPEPRKLALIAAGMLVALSGLWGISHYFGSPAEAAPSTVATAEQLTTAQQVQPAATAPVADADSDRQPEVIVRNFAQQRRNSRKPVQVATAAPMLTGELVVTSLPEGAQVQLDGRADAQWLTPYSMTGVPVGPHSVTISKPGYTTVTKTVEIAANQRPVITVALQPVAATLAITSEPSGAAVFLDGHDTGKQTPAQLSVNPGTHQLVFRKDGYFEQSSVANAASNQTVPVAAVLVLAGRTDQIQSVGGKFKLFGGKNNSDMGRLKVKTEPKGAYITINGKPAPDASPSEFLLNPGTYEVRMQLTGHPDIRRTVEVVKGKRIELDEVFAPR